MSNRALNHVWEHSKQTGSALLVLIAIADAANDDGECYPGVSRLADKCRMKDRNMQRIIRQLEADGEIEMDYLQGTSTQRGWTNRYRIVMEGVQDVAPVGTQGVQNDAPVGVQDVAPRTLSRTLSSKDTPKNKEKKNARVKVPPLPRDWKQQQAIKAPEQPPPKPPPKSVQTPEEQEAMRLKVAAVISAVADSKNANWSKRT